MIPLPSQPKIIEEKDNKAIFELEGLYPGFGNTVGNSLRRILLSSLEGAAITQVKIKGALHEFSALPGVLEDVVTILLNLKKLRFQLFSEEPQIAEMSCRGEKEATGKDFKLSAQTKLSNPEEHIATLTKSGAELVIEAQIEKGVGFSAIESRERGKSEVGSMPLDAFFTPVEKVSFKVENMRVGKKTDFDKLIMEVETDGTVSPKEAIRQSAQILLDHFALINQALTEPIKEEARAASKGKENASDEDLKKMKVEDLKISERVKNVLLNNNIKTVGGLSRKSAESLAALEGFGEKGLKEVQKALKKIGVELK